jgi:3-phenylpropionate/trans-cinnamate dioxygenase ferredoxin component
MAEFIRVASVADIQPGQAAVVELGEEQILLANVGGEFYAVSNVCSHAEAYLSEGYLDEDECAVECPLHGSLFDLRTGAPKTLPAFEPIATYQVRVEGEDVLIAQP